MSLLSMNELTTYRWSFEEDVRKYHAAGYQGIGLWREKLADYGEQHGARLLADAGIAVSSLSWAGGFTGSDGRPHLDAVEDALHAVRLAALLQAGCLIVHSGARAGHTRNHARRIFRDALDRLLAIAEPLGVTIALEPMHPACSADWTFLNGLKETLQILESYASPRLKLAFDTWHWGCDRKVLERVDEIVPYLALVQLGDGRHAPRGEPSRCRLGEGLVPLESLIAAFREAGYDGFFEVELIGEEIETEDYARLLDHSRQAFQQLASPPSRVRPASRVVSPRF